MPHQKILGAPLIDQIAGALDMDSADIQKIIIDADYKGVVKVYVQKIGDTRLLNIAWDEQLRDLEVTGPPAYDKAQVDALRKAARED